MRAGGSTGILIYPEKVAQARGGVSIVQGQPSTPFALDKESGCCGLRGAAQRAVHTRKSVHPPHILTIGTIRAINVLALTDAFHEIEQRPPSLDEIKTALALKDRTQAHRVVTALRRHGYKHRNLSRCAMRSALQSFCNDATGHTRREQWGMVIMNSATKLRGTNVLPGISVRPMTDRDAAEQFSAAIINLPTGRLAQAAHRSKDAAKRWKQARQCPSGASLINMARALPSVQAWLLDEIGYARDASAGSPDAVVRALVRMSAGNGTEAIQARALLREMARPDQPEEIENSADNVVRDMFAGRA